jgi:hypothetical protein
LVLNAVVSMSPALVARAELTSTETSARVIDDDCAARRQRDLPRVGGLDLMLDLKAREQRDIVLVELDAARRWPASRGS